MKQGLLIAGGYLLVAGFVVLIFRAGKTAAKKGTNATSVADESQKQTAAPAAQRLHLDVESYNGVLQ